MNLPVISAEYRCSHFTSAPNQDGTPGDCPPYGCLAGLKKCRPMEADPSGATMPACFRFHGRSTAAVRVDPAPMVTSRCIHLGEATGGSVLCGSCKGQVKLLTFACASKEASPSGACVRPTSRKDVPAGIGCCAGCPHYAVTIGSQSGILVEPKQRSDQRDPFNASLFRRSNGQLIMAYRTGQAGSYIHVCPVAEDLRAGPSRVLNLQHALCKSSREDPRLFEHRGKLHVAFVGVVGDPVNKKGSTYVLCAELNDDFGVVKTWQPKYADANPSWEKSWSMFSWQDQLFTVYSISPHRVLHVRDDGEALPFSRHELPMPWSGGHLYGGASPVLVGDRYWSWFHGSVEKGVSTPRGPASTKVYTVGVYTFEVMPPFRPLEITPRPLLWGDESTMAPAWCAVCYPCGAVLDGDRWRISMGIHDREIRVYEWTMDQVKKELVSL